MSQSEAGFRSNTFLGLSNQTGLPSAPLESQAAGEIRFASITSIVIDGKENVSRAYLVVRNRCVTWRNSFVHCLAEEVGVNLFTAFC